MEYTQREVKYFFTEAELEELKDKMVAATLKADKLDVEKKKETARFTADIKEQQQIASECAQNISDGFDYRDVECRVVRYPEMGQIWIIRTDNDEVIEKRRMSEQERQLHLDDVVPRETPMLADEPFESIQDEA